MDRFHQALSDRSGISLEQLEQLWPATSRHDAKFLMTETELLNLLDALGDETWILTIAQRKLFSYRTEYFDTVDRALYLHHVQRKLRRIKIRERTYTDSGLTQLEIKAREGTSHTRKLVLADSHGLDDRSRRFVSEFVRSQHSGSVTGELIEDTYEDANLSHLISSAVTHFTRMTLFIPTSTEKITIDLNLELAVGGKVVKAKPNIALVEVKSQIPTSQTVTQLRRLGLHPTQFSKYCSAIDLLASHRPRVHTRRNLERIFGPTSREQTN